MLDEIYFGLLASDPFDSANKLFEGWSGKLRIVALGVLVFIIVATGLIYAMGSRELKAAMKKKWLDVVIAIILIFGGSMIVTWFVDFVKQQGFQ